MLKGFVGEAMGSLAAKLFLNSKVYRSLNNVTLKTDNGTTQIDHVIVSRFGIFVIEAKNYQGWIFGRTLYEVQQILGHSDSKVTERYAHLSTKTLQAAANSASVIIKGAMKEAA
jgi:hypothetical protein